jgi:hypothetical protein
MNRHYLCCWLGPLAVVAVLAQGAFAQAVNSSAVLPALPGDSAQPLKGDKTERLQPPPCNSFNMENESSLGFHQKFCYYRDNKVLTGSALFGSLFFAGVAQMRNDPKEWSQGAEGYGKRFGTRYAQGLAKSTAEFLFGALNFEDPRPQPPDLNGNHSDTPTTIKGRLGAALLRTVWTHRDHGRKDFIAWSRIAGALTSGFIGNAWYPDRLSTTPEAFKRTGSAFGGYVMNSLFSEFQSDLFRLVRRMIGLSPKQPSITLNQGRR